MTIKVQLPDLELHFDARRLVDDLATELSEHFAKSMLAGRLPDGSSTPTNKKGQPYGRGDGTIARNWEVGRATGTKARASSTSAPYQEGGYFYVVRSLEAKGASPAATDGKAGQLIDRIVAREADRAVKA